MQFKIPFKGTQAEGITRVNQMLSEHRAQITQHAQNVSTEWKDHVLHFSFDAEGKHIEGTLTVLDGEMEVYAKLPLMMRLFEGQIERMIQAEVKKLTP